MPLVLGASNPLSGSGTWSYPDPTLIVGLKLELTTPPTGGKNGSIGSTVRFWRGIGRYALLDNAGPLAGKALFNDVVVDFDIGHGPAGINFEFADGAVVTATEILSSTPTGGGGPGGPMTSCQVSMGSYTSVLDSTLTTLDMDTTVFNTDTSNYTLGSNGITVTTAGVYRCSWHTKTYPASAPCTPGATAPNVNGSTLNDQTGVTDTGADNSTWSNGYVEIQLAASDIVTLQMYQASGISQLVTTADLTLSTG